MAQNKIQFQPALSLPELFRRYGSEELCEQALEAARWPQGFRCPRCQGTASWSRRRGRPLLRLCSGCGHQSTLASIFGIRPTRPRTGQSWRCSTSSGRRLRMTTGCGAATEATKQGGTT